MSKIIVAGGGHGGIATAMLLGKAGLDVEVFEKNERENMGYDWTDIFDPKALSAIGLPMPPDDKFEYKIDMTFYSPNEEKPILQRVPEDQREIKMERRDIYNMLISAAEQVRVKFNYGVNIKGAIIENYKVKGIKTDKGDFYADLVIDAAGCESKVRSSLPRELGIQPHPKKNEKFYVYRAFYNKASNEPVKDPYKVSLLPEGKLGIGWVATEEEYTDLLIGRFEKFDMDEVERTAAVYRAKNPSLGTEVKRGGYFAEIPVRQPIAKLVADGYAAIGDSAFMTVPIIGSGIGNTLKASPLLADVIIKNAGKEYTGEVLWEYQKAFYKEIGAGLAPLAIVKLLLTKLTPEQLDYIFEKNILTWREMTITADSTKLSKMVTITPDMPARGVAIVKDKALLKLMLGVAADMAKVIAAAATMPKTYDKAKILSWVRKYNGIF